MKVALLRILSLCVALACAASFCPAQRHLHARRAKLGLMPMSEYVKGLAEMYSMPVETESIPR
jgi:hypothetical protein